MSRRRGRLFPPPPVTHLSLTSRYSDWSEQSSGDEAKIVTFFDQFLKANPFPATLYYLVLEVGR